MADVSVDTTAIPGLLLLTLPLRGDNRGWFKENWQRATMVAAGLPDFGPVQHNMSFNSAVGVTRGIHAEPWDKLVSLACGRVFCAWVDLRAGATFGTLVTAELGPDRAAFVPYGVGNSFQTLEPRTVYSYLVNDHWSPQARDSYTYLNLADETVNVPWPRPLSAAEISAADAEHPRLADVTPMPGRRTVIVGANGQLGRALSAVLPEAVALDSASLDLTSADSVAAFDWRGVGTIVNAAAFTDVDGAETSSGRARAWAVNVTGVGRLVDVARQRGATLVHVSSDYVFDGTQAEHDEDEPVSPLGVYGQTKAAGDALVATLPRHYIVRTSWVIGEGRNFVATMARLAASGVCPQVVNDQDGRLTFSDNLAAGIVHLLGTQAPYGTYNLSNSGPVQSWAQIATEVFALSGRDAADVTPVSTAQFFADKLAAPRPRHSALSLEKIRATGYEPPTAEQALRALLQSAA